MFILEYFWILLVRVHYPCKPNIGVCWNQVKHSFPSNLDHLQARLEYVTNFLPDFQHQQMVWSYVSK